MAAIYCKEKNSFIRTSEDREELPQIVWHITDKCRLNCQYCFSTKSDYEADISKMDDYINKLKALGVQKIDISGGEPLEYYKLPELCSSLYESGFYITLTTKGIGLDENIQWLEHEYSIFSRIIFSIDLPSKAGQTDIVGTEDYDTFGNIIKVMRHIADSGYRNLRINTVVTKKLLLENNIEKMAVLMNEIDCGEWCLIQPHPANKKEKFDEISVTSGEFKYIIDMAGYNDIFKGTLLYRYAENYRDYWVLYPNNKLAKHTMNQNDLFYFDFFEVPASLILSEIMKNTVWVQEESAMKEFRITNIANDDLISVILQEIEREIDGRDDGCLTVIETNKQPVENKGLCICGILLAVAEGIVAAAIYDLLKLVINRFRNIKEYNPSAVIEIEYINDQEHVKIKVTLDEILDR